MDGKCDITNSKCLRTPTANSPKQLLATRQHSTETAEQYDQVDVAWRWKAQQCMYKWVTACLLDLCAV